MKVKWLSTKVMGNNFGILEEIAQIEPKNWEFFKQLVLYSQDDLFLSAKNKDKIMSELKISEPTYFNRLKWAEKANVLVKEMKGVYKFHSNWIKLLTLDVTVVGSERKTTKVNQKLSNLKI